MKIGTGSYSNASSRVPEDGSRVDSRNGAKSSKESLVAQSTAKAVQEALSRAMPSVVATTSLSAQLSVDPVRLTRLSGADKTSEPQKLDKAKLDEIKSKIENGEFEIDYGMIAQQLVQSSMRQKGRR